MSDLDAQDLIDLRKSLKATREALDRNTEQLVEFNGAFQDALTLLEQLMPMLEGAAAGSSALKMALPIIKSVWNNIRARRAKA